MAVAISEENLYQRCRACFNQTEGLQPLCKKIHYVYGGEKIHTTYCDLLQELLNIDIKSDNETTISQFICSQCIRKLMSSHSFIKQVQAINGKYLQFIKDIMYKQSEDKTEGEIKMENEEDDVEGELYDYSNLESIMEVSLKIEPIENPLSVVSKECDSESEYQDYEANIIPSIISTEDGEKSKNYPYDCADVAVACPQCKKVFKNTKDLNFHLGNAHVPEDKKSVCPICGSKFSRSYSMYYHMRTQHSSETVSGFLPSRDRRFQCQRCPRKYSKQKYLNWHIAAKHRGSENESLKQKISQETQATKDESTNTATTSTTRLLCCICASSFVNKTQLTIHMRRHTGDMPFKCNMCDKAFPRRAELTYHQRLHTGEKPYKCKLCEKTFRVSTKLKDHMRSHTNERPYKCKECEKSFKYSKDLNIHRRRHTGERPYCCNVCGSTFTQSNSLKTHRVKFGHVAEAMPQT